MSTGTPAYKLLEIAAAGTFGTVCVVRDLDRGTLVALKVLKEAHLHRPRVIARTRDEAAMLSQIHHPGIVRVGQLLYLEDRPVLVMEWVRGLSLEAILEPRRRGLPLPIAVEIVRRVTLALGAAYHAMPTRGQEPMRIIHRDVKPSNLLLSVDGEVKVVDFGIARGDFEGKQAKTLSMVLGARGYLAPERLDGYDDKPSCDIYSLGIVLYELLTGQHVVLSVHRDYHTQAMERHLAALSPQGLSREGLDVLRMLLMDMCRYDQHLRPDHETLVRRLDAFIREYGVHADLPGWAHAEVYPQFRDRPLIRPIDHPAYPQLAFLERQARKVKFPAPPDVDQELRVFLRQQDWVSQREALEKLMVKNPHWSADPFLERLPSGTRAWWQFWGGPQTSNDEILAILSILAARPCDEVEERVQQLCRHADPEIACAAEVLLRRIVA